MEIVVTPITAIGVKAAMPAATRVRDLVARRCEIQIRFQGDDYRRSRDFFVTRESGSTFTMTIRGKPGFCLAALQNLIGVSQTDAPIGTPAEIFKGERLCHQSMGVAGAIARHVSCRQGSPS